MDDHDPIDPLERQLWERVSGPPGFPVGLAGPRGPAGCPSAMDLSAYLDGRFAEAARDEMEAHLAHCGDCRAAVREARAIGWDASLPLVAPALIESAKGLVTAPRAAERRAWVAAARWSFAAAASLAMALLAFQAGASSAGAAPSNEELVRSEMSLGLLGPAESWETDLDPLPSGEDLP